MRWWMIGIISLLFAFQGLAAGHTILVRKWLDEFEVIKGAKKIQVANLLMDTFY